jgi:hypothetical protein
MILNIIKIYEVIKVLVFMKILYFICFYKQMVIIAFDGVNIKKRANQ